MKLARREFFGVLIAGGALSLARNRGAQEPLPKQGVQVRSNLFAMDQEAARTVRRPRKANAVASVSVDERNGLEHHLRCQCGCTLDVYTCRTTDFSCEVSPAMHRDVMALVDGGYSAAEILDAFSATYGERVLMAPPMAGFNAVGWLAPFAAIGAGAVTLAVLIRHWSVSAAASGSEPGPPSAINATPDELERIADAVRTDDN
ncbi:MAG: hypothetical protein NVS4B3_05500 [Gemmatimonadaceae bacterium]